MTEFDITKGPDPAWIRYQQVVERARTVLREEIDKWRNEVDAEEDEYNAPGLALEMALTYLAMKEEVSMSAYMLLDQFCALTNVDVFHIIGTAEQMVSYASTLMQIEEEEGDDD